MKMPPSQRQLGAGSIRGRPGAGEEPFGHVLAPKM